MASVINNLFVCDNVGELPASFEGVAIVKGSPTGSTPEGKAGLGSEKSSSMPMRPGRSVRFSVMPMKPIPLRHSGSENGS